MNTFPFVLPYYATAMGLVILFAGVVVVTDRMRRQPSLAADFPATESQDSASVPG